MRNPAITTPLVMALVVALWPVATHATGETTARPQVRVIPPPATGNEGVEPDDLPGPPLEVVAGAASVRLPVIPDFAHADGRSTQDSAPAPTVSVMTQAPPRRIVTLHARNASVDALNTCNQAIAERRYKPAIAACRAAITAWPGNHLAWYGAGNAYMALEDWAQAAAALGHAVALRPDLGMYQMTYGIALYESEVARVREERARKERTQPAAAADPTAPRLDAAREALVRATTLVPSLWRAHGTLGHVYRDLRDPRAAAEELGLAIKANPGDRRAYIALAELYRRWGFHRQALAVAGAGTANVPRGDAATLWFEIAMSYEAMNEVDRAIGALTQAIGMTSDNLFLKLQRGRLYFVRRLLPEARRDLQAVVAAADASQVGFKQVAELLLAQIAGKVSTNAYRTCRAMNGCKVFSDPYLTWLADDWSDFLD